MSARSFVSVLAALVLAGCASSTATSISLGRPSAEAVGVTYGTILAEHRHAKGWPNQDGVHSAILAALGETHDGEATSGVGKVELIVREDGGRIISVMQTDAPHFTTGERVRIVHGTEARVVPAG